VGNNVGRDSVVGIVTCYRLDRPEIEFGESENFRTRPDWRWGPPKLYHPEAHTVFLPCALPGGKEAGAWR